MYDIIIIGGGPAGLTAALYSLRAGRKTLLMEEKNYGGQMAETSIIENMPGSPDAEGWELTMRFAQQVEDMQVETCYEKAVELIPDEGFTTVKTATGAYQGKKVILAMGVRRRRLGVPGEDRLAGRGVGWCAVCDGAFFRGQEVCVVGGGNTAVEDAVYLSGICSKVYLLPRRDILTAQKTLVDRLTGRDNIEILYESQVQEILGENKVTGVRFLQKGQEKTLNVGAVFIAIGLSPDKSLYEGVVETTEGGYIAAGEDCRTSVPGIFAAGDIRNKEIRQIVTALGDGAVAAELSGREL